MLLHIGCGNTKISEFVNIDHVPTKTTDLVTEAWDLGAFENNTVEYIYLRHAFEHLNRDQVSLALIEWRRVLVSGGIVHLVVPNIEFHARQLLGLVESLHHNQTSHAMAGFYGWDQADPHQWGYTETSLRRLLSDYGFNLTNTGIPALTERDREPWHLQVIGVK